MFPWHLFIQYIVVVSIMSWKLAFKIEINGESINISTTTFCIVAIRSTLHILQYYIILVNAMPITHFKVSLEQLLTYKNTFNNDIWLEGPNNTANIKPTIDNVYIKNGINCT